MSKPASKTKRVKKPNDEDSWSVGMCFLELKTAKRNLIWVASMQGDKTKGLIQHSAKGVTEIEAMLALLKNRFPKAAEEEGVE